MLSYSASWCVWLVPFPEFKVSGYVRGWVMLFSLVCPVFLVTIQSNIDLTEKWYLVGYWGGSV